MSKLDGKVSIVTGGASGIGEATARAFVAEGAKVVLADINEANGKALEQELANAGSDVMFVKADITNEEEIKQLVNKTVEKYGRIDVLFNNAGIGAMGASHELSTEAWQKVININLSGVFLMAKYTIQQMLKNGGGAIINTASILGHVGQAQTAAYTASKGAVVNLTRALGIEYAASNIRVNAVCPGYVDTPILNEVDAEMRQQLVKLHPIGRLGRPDEIAKAVVFLASDDASFVVGANLLVDGGYTAQ